MKTKILIPIFTLILSGCVPGSASKVICEGKLNGKPIVETMVVDGDKVIETEMVITTDLRNKGEYGVQEIESTFIEKSRSYSIVNGAQYTYKIEKDKGIETIILDFEKVSLDRTYNINLLDSLDSDFTDINVKTEKYKINGGTCKTKRGIF
ncbi:MAG: hypothetical protein RR565_00875 [Erysipelothrix sp.]